MGRYVANGVPAIICICKKNYKNCDVTKLKDEILKEVSKYVNIHDYDILVDKEVLNLFLKKEIFDENIHELIKELEPITSCRSHLLYNKKIDWDNFDQERYPINLKEYDDEYNYQNDYDRKNLKEKKYIECIDEEFDCVEPFYPINKWMIWGNKLLSENLEVYFYNIQLWCDWNKYDGEDETRLLYILNNLKKSYYKTKLGKDLIYYVSG